MKTEEEARKCWCPFARSVWAYGDARNGIFQTANRGATDDDCRCIAADCMAWRWGSPAWRAEGGELYTTPEPLNRPGEKLERVDYGYCGLAGKP